MDVYWVREEEVGGAGGPRGLRAEKTYTKGAGSVGGGVRRGERMGAGSHVNGPAEKNRDCVRGGAGGGGVRVGNGVRNKSM